MGITKWRCLTFSVGIMVDSCEPNIHEAAVPCCQEKAQARECRCDEVAVHLELRHDFWQGVREGEIVDLDVAQGHQSRDRHRRDEQAQSEGGDDERLGLGSHVQIPDEVDGHSGDDQVCQDAHDSCCDPAREYGCEVLSVMIQPRLCSVGMDGHTDERDHTERRYQCTQGPAEPRFVRFLGEAGEEKGDGEFAGPNGEEVDEVCRIDGLGERSCISECR